MRILLLADIHANWAALQAIRESYDLCFVVGDLVDYGLEPAACIDWVQRHAQVVVRGNHDHAAAQKAVTNGKNGFKYLSGLTRQLTWELLSAADLRYLASLPVTRYETVSGVRFLLVHATPRDPLDEYALADPDFWRRRLQNVDADVVCVGHTHIPYVLSIGNQTVVNPGSVGQPRDGNPAASYAVWHDGSVELKRVPYPVEAAVNVIERSRLPDLAKRMSVEVYRTGASVLQEPMHPANGPLPARS
jgi:putative phosphoesterase